MKIELKELTVREIIEGYSNDIDKGVVAYSGNLDVRPAYQREFVYKDQQRDAVIDTVRKGFPLNVMYWISNGENNYEVLDGQQRTISICEYVNGKFSINYQYFHNLEEDEQEQIMDYKLMIYFCEGSAKEKLDWFKTINIAGEKLSAQELRNAVYTGEWLSDAKHHFSKNGCVASSMGKEYMKGSSIRQDYLETVINWIGGDKLSIEEYMATHQNKPNSNELWLYFNSVINWIKAVFPNYRKEMKGVPFGFLYNEFKDAELDSVELEERISDLMQDEDVTKKQGIYSYVLNGQEKQLSIRAFTAKNKREAYEKQGGICAKCEKHFKLEEMEADHITPWSEGGKTTQENCQMLCKNDNRIKSNK